MLTARPLLSTCLAGSLCLLLAGFSAAARAADPAPTDALWEAVSDRTLDGLRGGFDLGSGLMVSFGITRSVYINGELTAQTSLNFGQLAGLNSVQAAQLGRQLGALNLVVQTGPGNSIAPEAMGAAFATIIQNSLNNQQIIQQTVINATSNALGLIKNLNTQATVNDALSRAIGPR
jgi:hypothetical protein